MMKKFNLARALVLACTTALFSASPANAQPAQQLGPGTPPPATPTLEFVFEEIVTLGEFVNVGATAMGERTIIPITGGVVTGPGINGVVVSGGWDCQLLRDDGCREIKADYFIRTDDGAVIHILNAGVDCPNHPPPEAGGIRTAARFEPPLGKYEHLGRTPHVGVVEPFMSDTGLRVRIRFYRMR